MTDYTLRVNFTIQANDDNEARQKARAISFMCKKMREISDTLKQLDAYDPANLTAFLSCDEGNRLIWTKYK